MDKKRKLNTRLFRKLIGLRYDSQDDFALAAGFAASHVSRVLSGERNVTMGDLGSIGLALDINPSILYILLFDEGDAKRILLTNYNERPRHEQAYLGVYSVAQDFLKQYVYAHATKEEEGTDADSE